MIETTVRALLLANSAVAALVGTRIYPLELPQGPTFPALTYQVISDQREGTFGGPSGLPGTLVQIDCWASAEWGANGYETLLNVYDAVRLALDGYTGTPGGGDRIQSASLENRSDYDEDGVKARRRQMDFRIFWNEPQA